jgi:colanic acid/amylovoran biosynthesis glycosyltransferase
LKKYKIAFVVDQFPVVSETFILNQITDMIDRGHEVKIYSFKNEKFNFVHQAVNQYKLLEKTTYFRYPPHSGVKKAGWLLLFMASNFNALIHESGFTFAHPGSIQMAIRNLSLSQSIAAFLRTNAFDIVHAHFGQCGAKIANLMATGELGGFKFFTTFHGYDLNPFFAERYKKKYKNLFDYADGVTVNSPYLREILLRVCPRPKNLILLQVGLRTDQYKKQPVESSTKASGFTILFCGRLVAFKAPDLAIRIMDLLVNRRGLQHITLRVVGDGKLRDEVERLIHEFDLKDHVLLLGALSQEQVIQEMNNAHLFLLPGIHERETGRAETQGLVIQEAQAMELPVVVSDAGGMKYGLLDGVSGFVVKEGDIEGFADKIELLINNEQLRASMAKAGRDFVVGTFDTKILGDKLSKLYAGI